MTSTPTAFRGHRPPSEYTAVRRPAGDEQRLPEIRSGLGGNATQTSVEGVLLPATWPTSTTARRSLRPASAAWPHWTPSATWTPRARPAERLTRSCRVEPHRPDDRPTPVRRPFCFICPILPPMPSPASRLLQSIAATDWDALHDGRNPSSATPSFPGLNSTVACARTGAGRPGTSRSGKATPWSAPFSAT